LANNLTGEFDVVAQFSVPAVDRLLAAMHGIKRFPHSLSLRIDDRPSRPERAWPTAVEIIDLTGDAVVEPDRIQDLFPALSAGAPRFDAVVNHHLGDLDLPPLVPSLLHGRAQLQLAPPALEIVDAATSRIKVRIRVRARYFADPQTPLLAQFAVGDLVLTTTVSQITSQVGNVVNIDLRGNAVQAEFEPTWSSQALFAADRASINRLITNTLRSSVLPSNTPLPADIGAMMFKAFTNPAPAVAILLNKAAPAGNTTTVNRVVLGGADFAFAVGADAVRAAFQPALDQIFATPIDPFPVSYPGPNPTYSVVLKPPDLALRPGRIALIIKGRATTPSWHAPNFNFTITQDLTLQPAGTTAELLLGALSISTDDVIANWFRGKMLDKIRPIRDQALATSDAAGKVRTMLDTERALGGFLRSLLTPARPDDQPQPPALPATLSYISSHIEPDGIVLRGELTLADWGPPHVEFQQIAPASSDPLGAAVLAGEEYSAFKSWIAGGVIDSFEWKRAFQQTPGFRDENRFVMLTQNPGTIATDGGLAPAAAGPVVAYRPMCVTITGRRLTASGPVVWQPVQASYCAFHWFPLLDVPLAEIASMPMVALTRPGPSGLVEVVGRAPSVRDDKARGTPNLVVHFGTAESAGQLHLVTEAIRNSGRVETPAAVVAVLDPGDLARARYIEGVIYAESDERWGKAWAVNVDKRPFTALIDAAGKVAWQHAGALEPPLLNEILRRVLRPSRFAGAAVVTTGPRIGHTPPNFLFSYAPGHQLTLRKLIGRPVILIFSKSDGRTAANVAAERISAMHHGWEKAVVLRIDAGATSDRTVQQAPALSDNTTVVDSTGAIASAYGISAWPTTVYIDTRGVVRDVRHAGFDTIVSAPPAAGASAARG
jgi:hypothetical protein